MDSSKFRDSFEELSNKASEELNIQGILEGIEPSKVLSCDT